MKASRERHDAMGSQGAVTLHTDTLEDVLRSVAVNAGVEGALGLEEIVALRLDVPTYWVRIDFMRHREDGTTVIFWERAAF